MTNKSVQTTRRSRLAVLISLGLAVATAACSDGIKSATSPSALSPASLAGNGPNNGQDTRDFSVSVAPTSVWVGATTLHVTVTRNVASGQSQKLGSVEIYVPSGLTIQSVNNFTNANWTGGVSGQTVRVGADAGNHKLDGSTDWTSVTFDIDVTSTQCGPYLFTAQASNNPYSTDPFSPNWTYTGGALSVTVTGCNQGEDVECDAAPAVANAYLDSINFTGGGRGALKRGDIINSVAQHMTEGARFNGIDPCNVGYRAAVIAYVNNLLPPV
jgi:hypothetical protein